jgi:hypothetical protein
MKQSAVPIGLTKIDVVYIFEVAKKKKNTSTEGFSKNDK